jgi:hypothetical protein
MDEEDKQSLHEYIDEHFGKKLAAQGKMIEGLQWILVIVVSRLHQAGVVPAQKIQDEIKDLCELLSGDPENRELVRMARDVIQTIDLALGKARSA